MNTRYHVLFYNTEQKIRQLEELVFAESTNIPPPELEKKTDNGEE